MKICIAGWYFRPNFLKAIYYNKYEAFVIKHREGDTQGIPSELYPNKGLEFGAYRQYVEKHWDGESDVLFLHDDTEFWECADTALEDVESLGQMGVEHAYIFPDEMHEFVNGGCHGRGMWISGATLQKLAADFPADMNNEGVTSGLEAQNGILQFHQKILTVGRNTGVIAIVPQFIFAHRGRIHDRMFVYRKSGPVPGGIVNVAPPYSKYKEPQAV